MISIQYQVPDLPKLDVEILKKTVLATLNEQSVLDEVDLSLILTNDEEVQSLNRHYRGYDKPTDVLSFEANETDPETGRLYLGDIVISLERAMQQAEQGGYPLLSEVQLLVVHGVLHLLGHDHAEADEKAKMWHHQAEVLARLDLSDIRIQEE